MLGYLAMSDKAMTAAVLSAEDKTILSKFLRGYAESAIAREMRLTEAEVRRRIRALLEMVNDEQ
ncbi:MAG: hypothetical protein CMM50_08960 [Rhodospirillaceae bacterium]|jgi:DNA-binding NarL/FixJ family response regulator|nr:hypothetical protein [Rhodospirillaceae bacterium]|tara:strand:- start:13 stop:204 length:192 start_codon:yes stop_codon:yes gene_type:complete